MSTLSNFQLALDISPVPMMMAARSGDIVIANEEFHKLFDYEIGSLVGRSVETLVPMDIREYHPELRDAYAKVPTKRKMGSGRELLGVTQFGQEVPLELALEPVIEGDQQWSLVVAIDIRQRKTQELRLHKAMHASASGMVMVDSDGRIVFANEASCKLLGYEEDELIGRPVTMLVPDKDRRAHPVFVDSFLSHTENRKVGAGRDLFARHREGHVVPVEISLTTIDTPDGRFVMSTMVDLSERVATSRAMMEKNIQLEALNSELTQFAYSASHDLKAPFASISGLLDICLDDLEDGNADEVQANLRKIIDICRRSAEKVEGILQVARVGKDDVPLVHFSLAELVDEIWADLTAGRSDCILSVNCAHRDPILAERPTYKIILENLMSNALHFRDLEKDENVINFSTAQVGSKLELTVEDNGIGITADHKPQVFKLFRRLDARSRDGLGLALVQKQVHRLGGEITFDSVVGEGAVFRVTLPDAGDNAIASERVKNDKN